MVESPEMRDAQVQVPAGVDDRLLVKRAQRGDTRAFEVLYRTHSKRVYALCRRLCGDMTLAEDLCQETFVRAWTGLASFRGKAAFGTWLHRVAVNAVLGHRRWSDSREDLRAEDLSTVEPYSAAKSETRSSHGLDLERAIAGLPGGARAVFVLHDVEGYRHREISEMTGMAVGTSKAHLHRARRLLREVLR
ncbi:MAG: sigma-70 family RNA polymerase sigma factor [Acidobacteriota bacterium]